jgi:FkbM family methyltransferase
MVAEQDILFSEFKWGNTVISYPKHDDPEEYQLYLREIYFLDVYRSNLLKENDFVLDLGANIGTFSILASKKVGKNGKVIAIEPNIDYYELLKFNIKKNKCTNIIPVNIGVASGPRIEEINYWTGRKFKFKTDSLEGILNKLNITNKINFIKMDIEGFESDVISNDSKIIKDVNIISIELHDTKKAIDMKMLSNGFIFVPLNMGHYYKRLIKNLFLHPIHTWRFCTQLLKTDARLIASSVVKYDNTNKRNVAGSYVKEGFLSSKMH